MKLSINKTLKNFIYLNLCYNQTQTQRVFFICNTIEFLAVKKGYFTRQFLQAYNFYF